MARRRFVGPGLCEFDTCAEMVALQLSLGCAEVSAVLELECVERQKVAIFPQQLTG
jgi:hypothetical protein